MYASYSAKSTDFHIMIIHIMIQDRQRTFNVTLKRVRVTIVAVENQEVCVFVALVMQHAKRMRHHLRSTLVYSIFPHYLIKGTIFGKKVIEHKMCVLIFSTTFVCNIYHCKKK
jgi:hypothetical protein